MRQLTKSEMKLVSGGARPEHWGTNSDGEAGFELGRVIGNEISGSNIPSHKETLDAAKESLKNTAKEKYDNAVKDMVEKEVSKIDSKTNDTVGSAHSGGGSGGGGSSRVICTHFYKKGMIDNATWRADLEYTFNNLSSTTVRGYHYWAIPYVRLMRKHSFFEKIMFPIAKYRAIELAYQVGIREKGSIRGKVIRIMFEPACYVIGTFCEQKDWECLWSK
ncbi:hypothetical protein LA284_004122 [Vibrio vulnificus]|uniref:hypothetical protein n=1 Tax=Vibrio vulnificus TaxID=672 RepID=UPI0002F1E9B2|nr:hypothetical protein [Vibrio vulnificus]EGQ7980577.1 hypothetical protein [Vibrio vulnificus]EGQ9992995.1 hypothetical protein [Vibrio vulnificus]EGR0634580.1 hypothetical protein [Vibrio vulnificus]EHK9017806.1 hypothetical protein [Vibrio vulnificus]EHU4997218.1 hypothetical protein [Vibrio vulnificus]